MTIERGDTAHDRNKRALQRVAARTRVLGRIRPTSLASPLIALMSHRRIVEVEGLRVFVDPVSHLGQTILASGSYEPETVRLFRDNIRPGDAVLDIGANEGFFAGLAASLVGPDGVVVAVEPQARLQDVLEINLALNARGRTRIVERVVAERDGAQHMMTLFPASNTGASSLVRNYAFGGRKVPVASITPATILAEAALDRVDFVKVDVEGFEPEVVRAMVPLFDRGAVDAVLLDYHQSILEARGIGAAATHRLLLDRDFAVVEGDVGAGYVLYRRAGVDKR